MPSFRPSNVVARLRLLLITALAIGAPALAAAQTGTITGRVVGESGQPLPETRVYAIGTQAVATTNALGQYILRTAPGTFDIRVLRVGYQEQKKPVTVAAGATVTLDFRLAQAVIKLTEIVTTATGEQRRVELGHSVASVGDVAKRVEETPVTNVYDLLVAKAPGVVVLPGTMTGSAGSIRIRGLNSLSLSNAPIWVVDGIRFTSGAVGVSTGGTATTFLNGLSPEEIENVEIVKGPSAATLYGTDAANGVIVVTTKKGRAGPARWNWFAEGGRIEDKAHYPDTYAIFGHTPTAPGTQVRCTLLSIASGACIQDSVTNLNIIEVPELSPLDIGYRRQLGVSVNGGTETVRYYVSGETENETGPVKLPAVDRERYALAGTPIRDEWMNPEKLTRRSFRANLNAVLSPKLDLAVTSGFVNSAQRLTQTDNNFFSIFYQSLMAPGFRYPALGITQLGTRGEQLNGNNGYTYGDIFQRFVSEDIQRFLGTASVNWRPLSWIQGNATIGIDLADRFDYTLCRFQECPDQGTTRQGTVTSQTSNNRNISGKLNGTATWQPRTWLNLQTSVGSDYTNIETDNTNSSGTVLPPGAQTVGAAATRLGGNTLPTANKTLGFYVQEQVAIRDRLFLTVATRSDQNSAFGTNFQRVYYPKASVSWLVSEEEFFPRMAWLNNFRLRSAYGASGVQPGALDAFVTFGASTVTVNGTDTPGIIANRIGNPDLKPESSNELEAGFESRVFDRINIDFTYYNKKTKDALIDQPIAPSAAAPVTTLLRNLGSIKNSGVEVLVTTNLVQSPRFAWDVTIGASKNANEVVSLGVDATGVANPTIGTGTVRQEAGKPINALFYRPYTYEDKNGNNIIEATEVNVDSAFQYLGYSSPTTTATITNGIELFNRKLRLNAGFDYKGGFYIQNGTYSFQCGNNPACPARSNPAASLEDQAAYVATTKNPSTSRGYAEKADYWRLRELSATFGMPDRWATMLRARDASLSFGGRNLKVWTKYKGADPEENYNTGDQQTTFASSAPRAYYTLRFNLHY